MFIYSSKYKDYKKKLGVVFKVSSYKSHAIAGILFALPFISNVFYLFFALLGASVPDLDHQNNKHKVYSMIGFGVVLSVLLFFLNGDVLSGLVLILLGVIFYFSHHRGFSHTLVGIVVLSCLFSFMFIGFVSVLMRLCIDFGVNVPFSSIVFIVMVLIGYFVIHRRYLMLYILALAVYLVLFGFDFGMFNWYVVFGMFLVGGLSHLILDLRTPAGLSLFKPFIKRKFHQKMALFLFIIWLVVAVGYLVYFNPLI